MSDLAARKERKRQEQLAAYRAKWTEGLLQCLQERLCTCQEIAQAMADPVLRADWRGEAEGIRFCIDQIVNTSEET